MPRTNAPTIYVRETAYETEGLLAGLLNLANDFRAALNGKRLERVPGGVQREPSRCILANALNFNCSIVPCAYGPGHAFFKEREHAERFVELTGQDPDVIDGTTYPVEYGVPLTPELNAIAVAFDDDQLPELES